LVVAVCLLLELFSCSVLDAEAAPPSGDELLELLVLDVVLFPDDDDVNDGEFFVASVIAVGVAVGEARLFFLTVVGTSPFILLLPLLSAPPAVPTAASPDDNELVLMVASAAAAVTSFAKDVNRPVSTAAASPALPASPSSAEDEDPSMVGDEEEAAGTTTLPNVCSYTSSSFSLDDPSNEISHRWFGEDGRDSVKS
jgi:hypothetical protein